MLDFAGHLIAHEMARKSASTEIAGAMLVCDRLRLHLATLMGSIGFRALLSRALALAGAEIPSLRPLHINADVSIEGPTARATSAGAEKTSEGGVVLVAQLLGLLVTFIGEDLTLRLVREIWPKAPFERSNFGKGNKSAEPK